MGKVERPHWTNDLAHRGLICSACSESTADGMISHHPHHEPGLCVFVIIPEPQRPRRRRPDPGWAGYLTRFRTVGWGASHLGKCLKWSRAVQSSLQARTAA